MDHTRIFSTALITGVASPALHAQRQSTPACPILDTHANMVQNRQQACDNDAIYGSSSSQTTVPIPNVLLYSYKLLNGSSSLDKCSAFHRSSVIAACVMQDWQAWINSVALTGFCTTRHPKTEDANLSLHGAFRRAPAVESALPVPLSSLHATPTSKQGRRVLLTAVG